MTKIYDTCLYYKINDEEWRKVQCNCGVAIMPERDSDTSMHFEDLSFEEAQSFLKECPLPGIDCGRTLFRKRPYIQISHSWENYDRYFAKDIDRISYKTVYYEDNSYTIKWLMGHASADVFIKYMKERGMTVCPLQ